MTTRGTRGRPWLLALALVGGMSLLGVSACSDTPTSPDKVPIRADFGSKIVYGTSPRLDTDALRADCTARGGTFNTCGTICAPAAAACAAVCAYTCEDIR